MSCLLFFPFSLGRLGAKIIQVDTCTAEVGEYSAEHLCVIRTNPPQESLCLIKLVGRRKVVGARKAGRLLLKQLLENHLPEADLLIIDEAHFAVSPTWKKVVAKYPQAKILGMTATPIRLDGRGLGEMFQTMVPGPGVQSLIDQGYLVPSVVFRPKSPDLSGVKKVAGDFNSRQLAEVCDKPKLVGDVVEQWQKHCPDRKTAAVRFEPAPCGRDRREVSLCRHQPRLCRRRYAGLRARSHLE